jgi:hypothetical protein
MNRWAVTADKSVTGHIIQRKAMNLNSSRVHGVAKSSHMPWHLQPSTSPGLVHGSKRHDPNTVTLCH